MRKLGIEHSDSDFFVKLADERDDEVIANMIIVLIHQEDVLLRKHIEKQLSQFVNEGGFKESLAKARIEKRKQK
jgi:four helix bundle suffix protein